MNKSNLEKLFFVLIFFTVNISSFSAGEDTVVNQQISTPNNQNYLQQLKIERRISGDGPCIDCLTIPDPDDLKPLPSGEPKYSPALKIVGGGLESNNSLSSELSEIKESLKNINEKLEKINKTIDEIKSKDEKRGEVKNEQ